MTKKICSVDGCDARVYGKGLCLKHYKQVRSRGKVYKTWYERNTILVKEDHAEVILLNRYGDEVGRSAIDIGDVDRVSKLKWRLVSGYAQSGNGQTTESISLHKYIAGFKVTDHINRNRLDNRKCNLREATIAENNYNRPGNKGTVTGFKGVRFRGGKYFAKITIGGKELWLGTYETSECAAMAYDAAAIKHFGEFAYCNFGGNNV